MHQPSKTSSARRMRPGRWLAGAALVLAPIVAGAGCTSEVTDEGAGGGPSCSGLDCCPTTALPENETSCEGDRTCSYDSYQCATDDRIAECADGQWTVMSVASCDPLPDNPSCDPYGTWRIVPQGDWEPSAMGWLLDYADSSYDITAAQGAGGGVLIEGTNSSISPDGCTWSTSWTLDYDSGAMDGESWSTSIDLEIDVTLEGDGGTGTMKIYCWGECGGEIISTVTVERVSP